MGKGTAALTLPKGRIVAAMSGGVDSSVAAALLLEQHIVTCVISAFG